MATTYLPNSMSNLTAFFTKEKIHAFLIHLSLSLLIFLVLLYFILVEWYPHPLFTTDGGWEGIRLIAFVDIVLGPMLTLVVFKKDKPKLMMDLIIIAVLQFAALISGTWVVYNEHPALVVFNLDQLKPITAYQVRLAGASPDSIKRFSDTHPPMTFLDLPTDLDEVQELYTQSLRDGRAISLFGELYRPLTVANKKIIRNAGIDMDVFLKDRPKDLAVYQHYKKQNQDKLGNVFYIKLHSRYIYVIAVVEKDTFKLVDVLDIIPYISDKKKETMGETVEK